MFSSTQWWQEWRRVAPQEVEGGGDGCGEGVPFGMCFEGWDLGRRAREDWEWPAGFWVRPRLPGIQSPLCA